MKQKEPSNEGKMTFANRSDKYAQSTAPNIIKQQTRTAQHPKHSSLNQIEQQLQKLVIFNLYSLANNCAKTYTYMTLKSKVICQERKIAALTRDFSTVVNALRKCPLVEIQDTHGRAYGQETLKILTGGDLVILRLTTNSSNNINQLKKQLYPLLKDIKHQLKQHPSQSTSFQIEFQSQTSLSEFLQRIKSRNLTPSLQWELIQKDPYECIKKSVKFLLKERKNQQYQYGGAGHGSYGYSGYGGYGSSYGYGGHGGYNQYYQYHQDSTEYTGNTTPLTAYSNMASNPYTKNTIKYQTFIRKAVESEEQEQQDINKKQCVGEGTNRTQQYQQQSQQQRQSQQPKQHYKQKSEQSVTNTNKSDKNYRNEGKSRASNRKNQKNNTHYEKNKNHSNGNSIKEPIIDDSQFPTL